MFPIFTPTVRAGRYAMSNNEPHVAGWLALVTAEVRTGLGVQPRWTLLETVARSMAWQAFRQNT